MDSSYFRRLHLSRNGLKVNHQWEKSCWSVTMSKARFCDFRKTVVRINNAYYCHRLIAQVKPVAMRKHPALMRHNTRPHTPQSTHETITSTDQTRKRYVLRQGQTNWLRYRHKIFLCSVHRQAYSQMGQAYYLKMLYCCHTDLISRFSWTLICSIIIVWFSYICICM